MNYVGCLCDMKNITRTPVSHISLILPVLNKIRLKQLTIVKQFLKFTLNWTELYNNK
jgi:hypothetical protein